MVEVFLVDDQKPVVWFCKVLQFDLRILLIVFVQVCLKLVGDVAGEDGSFYAGVSFGQQMQNCFVNIVINQNDWVWSSFYQLSYKLPGIESLAIEEDALCWFQAGIDNELKFLVML